jgi:putative ABC transport system permease protein
MSKNHIHFLAEVRESFLMAMNALTAHKLRSALTLLGVLIGVFSIIVVMTAIRAMQSNVAHQLSSLGSQTFMISKWPGTYFGVSSGDYEKYWRRKDITMEQGKRLLEKTTLPVNIGLETRFWSGEITTHYKSSAPNVRLYGETPGSLVAHNWNLAEGRPLLDADVDSARNVCVLAAGLATTIFPNSSPVGDEIKIDGINYAVVGVLEKQGSSLGGDEDNFAVIPLTTGLNRYGRQRSLRILVEARDEASYQDTLEEARGAMRAIRKVPPNQDDDFEIASNDSMIAQFDSFTRDVRIGAGLISSIALLAAGVGIMNIMLVSVTERTREIGVRRAIGAKKRNIMVQFIIEAIVLCEVGGVAGVIFGILGGDGMAALLKLPPVIPFDWVVIGLVTCSIVGVIFGTYPAYKAANLDPIESLRYE